MNPTLHVLALYVGLLSSAKCQHRCQEGVECAFDASSEDDEDASALSLLQASAYLQPDLDAQKHTTASHNVVPPPLIPTLVEKSRSMPTGSMADTLEMASANENPFIPTLVEKSRSMPYTTLVSPDVSPKVFWLAFVFILAKLMALLWFLETRAGAVPALAVNAIVIMVYICVSVGIDLVIIHQKKDADGASSYSFHPLCSVILVEFIKLLASWLLHALGKTTSGGSLMPENVSVNTIRLFCLPAALFTANNVMVFLAIGGNDAGTFGVFRDTMILWTALIWVAVFRASLGFVRLSGIAVIFIGLVVNRAGSMGADTFNWTFLLVLLMTVINACGAVSNEYALKETADLDINIQNFLLYAVCVLLSVISLAVTSPFHLASTTNFFQGFTRWTVLMVALQASAGLLVSRLLKYADAIYKTIGTCLRGPCLVVASHLVIGTRANTTTIASALIVAFGSLTYLTQGPLKPGGQADSDLKVGK